MTKPIRFFSGCRCWWCIEHDLDLLGLPQSTNFVHRDTRDHVGYGYADIIRRIERVYQAISWVG